MPSNLIRPKGPAPANRDDQVPVWSWVFPKPSTKAAAGLFCLTFCYLCFELAFNARLLDVAGRPASAAEIRGIEVGGRIISGCAIALALFGVIWGWQRKYHYGLAKTLTLCAVGLSISVMGAFTFERAHVDSRVSAMSNAQRGQAAMVSALTEYLYQTGQLSSGIKVEAFQTPGGKSLYALFPRQYLAVLPRVLPQARAALESGLQMQHEREANAGAHESWLAEIDAVNQLRDRYNSAYLPAANQINGVEDSAKQAADKAWLDYIDMLGQHNWQPDTVPDAARATVISQAEQQIGATLGPDWALGDDTTFKAAVSTKFRNMAKESWAAQAAKFGDPNLSADLTFDGFLALPVHQQRLRDALLLDAKTPPVIDGISEDEWYARYYQPNMDRLMSANVDNILAHAEEFGRSGPRYCYGVNAAYAILIPSIALFLSVIGAAYHFSKLVWYAASVLIPSAPLIARIAIRLAAVTTLLAAPMIYRSPDSITRYPAVHELMIASMRQGDVVNGLMAGWIVRAEELYYPLNEAVHNIFGHKLDFTSNDNKPECP